MNNTPYISAGNMIEQHIEIGVQSKDFATYDGSTEIPGISDVPYSGNTDNISNFQFLEAIFSPYKDIAIEHRPQVLSFSKSPNHQKDWSGSRLSNTLDLDDNSMNWYFTLALYRNDTTTKRTSDCVAICGLMLDDIGTKALPLSRLDGCPPSYVIETSKGNYQVGYLFIEPQTDFSACNKMNKALIAANLCDAGATGPTSRWGRLPAASNNKYNPVFQCRLVEWHPERRYTLEQITEGLELGLPLLGREIAMVTNVIENPKKKIVEIMDSRNEDVYTPKPIENIVITALKAKGLYKQPKGDGVHEVTCPWVTEHTDQVDHGTAYIEPSDLYQAGGFKCQHSHGNVKRLGSLLDFLNLNFQQAKHKPTIRVSPGELHRIADAAERELARTGRYYQRGGLIVGIVTDQTTNSTEIQPLKLPGLVRALAGCAVWEQYDKRSQKYVVCDPPARHAGVVFDAESYNHLPALMGLARQPFLRKDSLLVTDCGFDPISGLFGVFDPNQFSVPISPTREMALDALKELKGLLSEFAFANKTDEAAALAGMLTAAIRPSLAHAPMLHVKAPQIASGKSYLTSLISTFASPTAPAALGFPSSEEECEKLLLSTLMTAPAVIVFDNLTTDLYDFKKLCSSITEEFVSGRILGISKIATVPTRALFMSSGNNVGPVRDMTRRTITITLDPQVEVPAARRFSSDPLRTVRENRGKYVSLALIIVTAWIEAGRPLTDCKPVGSFGDWREMVCQPLMWLGQPDPAASIFTAMASDPDRETLGRLMNAWNAKFGKSPTMIREAVSHAQTEFRSELNEVFKEIAEVRGEINRIKLGKWISRHSGRIVGGLRFEKSTCVSSAERWRVITVKSTNGLDNLSESINNTEIKISTSKKIEVTETLDSINYI